MIVTTLGMEDTMRNSVHATVRHDPKTNVVTIAALMLLGFSSLFVARPAHAQWQVTDKEVTQNTGNTADNTKQIEKDLSIDKYKYASPGDRIEDPKQYPLNQSTTTDQDKQLCSRLPEAQQAGCIEIVETEDAQSQYMKVMYETTAKRNDRLNKILEERQGISGSNLGALEDNTNKLVALYTLMAIDRQQMESVNFAYETRLRYLRNQQTQLANAAATGTPMDSTGGLGIPLGGSIDVGSLMTGLTTGVALKAALSGVQSPTPSGMRTLSSGESNGF